MFVFQLDENVPTEAMERTVTYFSTAYPTHLVGEGIDRSLYLSDVARALSSAAAATTTAAATITTLVHVSVCVWGHPYMIYILVSNFNIYILQQSSK